VERYVHLCFTRSLDMSVNYPDQPCMRPFTRSSTGNKHLDPGPRKSWQHLLFAIVLILPGGCSPLLSSVSSKPAEPDYGRIVASYLRQTFKGISPYSSDPSPYSDFEISGLRWVHARTGWNWLTCVRFSQRGKSRTFAFYLQDVPKDVVFSTEATGKLTELDTERINRLKSANLKVEKEAKFVAEARYAVVIDDCDSQSFTSFNLATGAIGQDTPAIFQLRVIH
jgi:hypothetical protein